jgi:hypothetical protein
MKTAAIVAGALVIVLVVVGIVAVRGLRKFVRSVWPHS